LLLAFALILLVACGGATPPAATIAGVDLTDEQLAHQKDLFKFLSGLNQQPCGTKEDGETQDSACSRFALTNMIQERFVADYAKANDIVVSDADVTSTLKQLDDSLGKKLLNEQLDQHDLTRDDLSGLAHLILLHGRVQTAVTEDRVSQAELEKLYQDNILDYTTVQLQHILVDTQAEAQDVYAHVTAPGATEQTFTDLAKKVSIDPNAADNGGILGSATASQYVKPLATAAAPLEPGEISQPVHTQLGWHVIRMVDKQVQSFDEVKASLIDSRSIVEFNAWMREQIDAHGVDVNPKYGRFDTDTLQVVRISSTESGSGAASVSSPSA
jgi:parvulin-like peptidyl-prolyl isomerase